MKKILSLLLALMLFFSLTACADYEVYDQYESVEVTSAVTEELYPETEAPTLAQTEPPTEPPTEAPTEAPTEPPIDEGGEYYSAEDVALYLHTYGYLPRNFITKSEARGYGWSGGSVEAYVPGAAIGGDRFYNREGLLPEADGRKYYECDIDTKNRSSRGAKRIVYSNDGLIYYTKDHYASFVLLYGEE